jgi:glycine/D-amino acid oxidase-like deaminating enzyme
VLETGALWQSEKISFERREVNSEYDVCIVGGGFSGLWSAYHLLALEPTLKIAIFEAYEFGFGASGRNGGWASGEFPVSKESLIQRIGAERTHQLFEALHHSIDEIVEISDPSVGAAKSGSLYFARNSAQLSRLKERVDADHDFLSANEAREMLNVDGIKGGLFTRSCATINPFNLIKFLVGSLSKRGVHLSEKSFASASPGGVLVNSSFIKAGAVIQATEAFADPGRDFIPLYSLMVATEPISDSLWQEIGNASRFTFAEASHMVNYAQRTSDNRIAIGGRGATYPFGSKLDSSKEKTAKVHATIRSLLRSWFPILKDVQFTHAWGGAVAITRDWEPYLYWDRPSGLARLGGYAGDGVTMSYLASKIIAHEILEKPSELSELHFVNRKIRKWEPEPIRYLGVNALMKLSGLADKEERITGRKSLVDRVISPLILR